MKKRSRPRCAPRTSTIKHPPSNIHGLTLIELLVVIVILTTLVAGVIPILSPNNDGRRIREATRMLQTYIVQAQAEAARTGRAQGIAFQESSAGSGVALDVFRLEVPEAFAGFSSASMARIIREEAPVNSNNFTYYLQFVLADSLTGLPGTVFPPDDYGLDPVPPRLIRRRDSVLFGGTGVLLTDGTVSDLDADGIYYITTTKSIFEVEVDLAAGKTLAFIRSYADAGNEYSLTALKSFKFLRQPTNSAESPMQFPAGIGIDMQGSIAEGGATGGFPIPGSFDDSRPAATEPDTIGIMFSSTGAVSNVYHNGNQVTNVSRITLLLGRVENGNLEFEPSTAVIFADVTDSAWKLQNNTQDELEQKQETVNWLNLDSRWLSIAANSGRVVVSENAFVNADVAFGYDFPGGTVVATTDVEKATHQIEAAHEFAHEMRSTGAGR